MIPKVIHYCWFGGAPKPESVLRCIESWKSVCPDYEIREWTEKDIDLQQNLYSYQAYQARCWGFVPDYWRLWIIYHYGGIYLDTDVRVLKKLDPLLQHEAFAGFEADTGGYVALGLGFGAEAGNPLIKEHMEMYHELNFVISEGEYNKVPAPVYTTQLLEKYGLDRKKKKIQQLKNITIYPEAYFCPQSFLTGCSKITKKAFSVHLYDASWLTEEEHEALEKAQKKARYLKYFYKLNDLRYNLMVQVLGFEKYERLKAFVKGKKFNAES